MEDIIHILNQKWAVILAFIPGVNLLYLIFRFLTVSDKRYSVPVWKIGLAVFPVCLLYLFVPDSWNWLVPHLILSVVAFIYIKKSWGGYRDYFHFPIPTQAILPVIVSGFFLVTSVHWIPAMYDTNQLSNKVTAAVEAIIQDDEDEWQELIHPVYGTELLDLQKVKNDMRSNNITLHDTYRFGGRSTTGSHYVEDGKADWMEKTITSGSENYLISVVYQTSDNGSGFIEFEIVDVFP